MSNSSADYAARGLRMPNTSRFQCKGATRLRLWGATLALFTLLLSGNASAQNSNFNVTVNVGPVAPNNDTVYPGEGTSLRVTLSNNSTVTPLTGVGYSNQLPVNPINGLLVSGASAITGDAGCVLGTLTTTIGQPAIMLAGLTVPVRQDGVAGSGECYLDIPLVGFSVDGNSTSLSYNVGAGQVNSDQGVNATGGPQAYTLRSVLRPTWSKNFLPNNLFILGGASRTLRITLNNPDSNVDLTGIAFTDIFPVGNTSGMNGAMIEPTGAAATGNCGGTVALTQGIAAQVAVTGVDLATGGSCFIDVAVRGRHTDGVYNLFRTNTIFATSFTSNEGLRPANNATRNLSVRSPLAVTKSFNPSIVASGQVNTFRVTLTNNGNVPLPISSFTDDPISRSPFEDRLTITGGVVNSCGGANVVAGDLQGFTVSGFSIPANSSCNIDVTYTGITPNDDTPTTYTNRIPRGTIITSVPGIVSQARSATVLVADRLRVLKSRSPANASPGDPVRYTLTVQNFSGAAIADVTVTDALQNGSTLLLGGGFAPTLSGGCGVLGLNGALTGDSAVTFTLPTVPGRTGPNTPGSCTLSFSAMLNPSATTPTLNTVGPGGVCFGSGPAICNSVGSPVVNTNALESMALQKTFDGQENVSKNEGTVTRLRLEITNNSISPLTSLTFSDTLPTAGPFQQLRIAAPASIANSCGGTVTAVPGSTSVSLNNGAVPARVGNTAGSCSLEVDVVGPAGTYPNSADAVAIRANADGSTTLLSDSDGATLTYNDALAVGKSFNPTTVGEDGRATASIRFTSLDTTKPVTNIAVTDNLPAGMLVASPANSYTTCNGPTTVVAVAGANQVSITGANLVPLGSCELRFEVTVTGNTSWVNTIPAGGVTATGGLTNRSAVSATLFYVPPEVPLISKAINPGTIVPGQSALLTINITNGLQDLTNVQVADYFTLDGVPGAANNGMRIAAAPEATTTCPNGILTAMPEGDVVRLSGANLPANSQCQVQVRVTSTTVGTLTNTIPMNSIASDQGATNSTTFAQSTLSTTSSIGVSKLFEPPVVSPSQSARLRITIYNSQPAGITGISLTDNFPAGLISATPPNPLSDCGGSVVVSYPTPDSVMISGGSLGPANGDEASSCFLETDVVAAAEGTYLNSIPENALQANGTPVPHPPTEGRLEVRERLIVNKAIDGFTLDTGNPVGFITGFASRLPGVSAPLTIRIENPNNIPLTEVNFVDTLPDGLVLAQVPALATDCVDGSVAGVGSGRDITLTGVTLAAVGNAGAICTVTANVVSNIPGIYTNEIPAGDVRSFEGVDNDPLTQAQIIIITEPGISKDIAPPVIAPNAPAVLTIVIENDNDLPMSLLAPLVDNLPTSPDQVVVTTPSVISTTCPGGNAIITANAGADFVSIATGAVIPASGCVVTAQITAATPGDYLNFIPIAALNTTFGLNDEPTEAPLKVSTLGYIAGRVFLDNQMIPDGLYIPGSSTPIAGNTIELHSGSNCSGPAVESVDTDAMGTYLFSDLLAGTFTVCQRLQPTGTLNSVTVPGIIVPIAGSTGTPGAASNPPGGDPSSQIVSIVLQNNGNANEVSGSPENNFSEVLPVSISGHVYYDANGNGVFDADESGIGGATVDLSGPVNAGTVTDADGNYSFVNLPPGEYSLLETQPSPWSDGQEALGAVDGAVRGNIPGDDVFNLVALAPGEAGINYDFGEVLTNVPLTVQASAFCLNDAPRVNYSLPQFAGAAASGAPLVTLSWLTTDDRLVAELTDQPASGVLLWPGAAVDGADTGVAWPGWMLLDGNWVTVPDDRVPEMILRITINPTAEASVFYPPNSSSCLTQPPGTTEMYPVPGMPRYLLFLLVVLLGVVGFGRLGRSAF